MIGASLVPITPRPSDPQGGSDWVTACEMALVAASSPDELRDVVIALRKIPHTFLGFEVRVIWRLYDEAMVRVGIPEEDQLAWHDSIPRRAAYEAELLERRRRTGR